LLTDITGVSKEAVNIALLLFGGATVMGNLAGGMLSDEIGLREAMMILLCGLIVSPQPSILEYQADPSSEASS
jgi:DHA1 family inner membrane transport protein